MKAKFLIPVAVFVVLAGFFYVGLNLKPSEIPSPLINKAAPGFQLSLLKDPAGSFSPAELKGRVWVFNVWASWCGPCRDEIPVLMQLASTREVPIYGLNYKDTRQDALRLLERYGNPYTRSAFDPVGNVGIDYGVYGVPETYIIDRDGIIRHKHIGPVTEEVMREELLPLVRKLKG
ncbi:MAG TPA: DsbE family thiol:disulfide interchange protein [Gammaproteobacteria bacterium]|nr:DsbE family thiol:disulfide interchange protein [Gammaproteobacteria bacterium]